MTERKYYPPDEEVEDECIHGIPTWQHCDECAKDDEGDEKYHALKDDGLLDG